MITISTSQNPAVWDDFLLKQRFTPFLQSWTMGEVYREIGQGPLRWEVRDQDRITGICFGHIVPARRGKHLSIPYGPVLENMDALSPLLEEIKKVAKNRGCSFIRMSPFWPVQDPITDTLKSAGVRPSPLHLLAEHLWYLPLGEINSWDAPTPSPSGDRSEEDLLKHMRPTTRNLIRRAAKDGVTIALSDDPLRDLEHFLKLHDETRRRHGFTPYTDRFFRAQVKKFAPQKQALLYLARYQEQIIAASIHMHFGTETSYHHGASAQEFRKIPASYLLQWTAITDALKRGDHIYNFWGIAPLGIRNSDLGLRREESPSPNPEVRIPKNHPFAGVTLFKTGFGGKLLELQHCVDIPLSASYHLTRVFENVRKWRRGF